MSKTFAQANLDELDRESILPVWFAEIVFETSTQRLWTGVSEVEWGGYEWTPCGNLAKISEIGETQDLRAEALSLELSGIDSTILGSILGDLQHKNDCSVWIGLWDYSAGELVADPELQFIGTTDTAEIVDGGTTATIKLRAENRLIVVEEVCQRRYTNADQQDEFPGDEGFEYAAGSRRVSIGGAGGIRLLLREMWRGRPPFD